MNPSGSDIAFSKIQEPFQIWDAHQSDKQTMYLEFYKEVVRRTARLVVGWQAVGWCHGFVFILNRFPYKITFYKGVKLR